MRCFEKVGFKIEGCFREEMFQGGQYKDRLWMGFCDLNTSRSETASANEGSRCRWRLYWQAPFAELEGPGSEQLALVEVDAERRHELAGELAISSSLLYPAVWNGLQASWLWPRRRIFMCSTPWRQCKRDLMCLSKSRFPISTLT